MKKKMFFLSSVFFSLLTVFLLLLNFSFAQQFTQSSPPNQVTVTGYGNILANDVAHARDDAINDAMRKAVEQVLGTYLSSQTLVENYMLVEDNILTWTRGYIKDYKILSERQAGENTYEVTLQATISTDDLQTDAESLQNLIARMGNPRLLVMIQERNIGQSYEQYHYFDVDMTAAETALIDVLMAKGLEFVDPTIIKQKLKKEQALAALAGDTKAAVSLGHDYGAEVVILGKAMAKVATGVNLYGMKSCQADVTARAVNTDTGTIIATASAHAAKPHIDELTGGTMAIQAAAKKVANELLEKILRKWRESFYSLNSVQLRLENVQSYDQLNQIKGNLKYLIRGIKNIFERRYQGSIAELDLKITGNAKQLARELSLKDFHPVKFKVLEVTQNAVRVRVSSESENSSAPSD
ncbi:flagellar assembly protein T N-terminal domain-containing protein [bacterium]|nr:flagellar assembly protein T N-terminal domain-containing protein [bacterium]